MKASTMTTTVVDPKVEAAPKGRIMSILAKYEFLSKLFGIN